jgi:phage terminase large subunit GpA-like protein
LDCRVYARAAASIFGLDRMSDYKWRALEKSLGQEVIIPTKGVEMPVPVVTTAPEQPKQTPSQKPRVPQRKVIKADDPYL